jgi:hypothetical protein
MADLIQALTILLKYGNPRRPTHCEHDVMYICGIDSRDVSEEDIKILNDLGFFLEENECEYKEDQGTINFMSFRFGSA